MAVDGSLIFDTRVDTDGFNQDTQNITKSLGGFKSAIGKVGVAIAAAFSVKVLVDFGKQAIETASDLQEVQNVVDTAFEDMSYKMERFADNAIEQFGISKLAAKQTGSTFMAMSSGMGVAKDAASDMAIALTGLSADMASFFNVEQSVASTALKSVFTGETETLKQFGIVMTEANLEAFALSKGITKNISAMTQAEKVQLRYQYVMQQTALAQGDFAKTSDSWANQTRILSERWKEFSSTIGGVLVQVALPVVQALNKVLSSLISYAQSAANALADLFGWEWGASLVSTVAEETETAAENYEDMATSAEKAKKANEKSLAAFDELNILANNSKDESNNLSNMNVSSSDPSVAVSSSVEKIKKEMSRFSDWIYKLFPEENILDIAENFKTAFSIIKEIAADTFDGTASAWESFTNSVGSFASGISSTCVKAFDTVSLGVAKWLERDKEKITKGINTITGNLSKGFGGLEKTFNNVFGALGDSIDQMREPVSEAVSNLLSGFSTFGLSLGEIVSGAFSIWSQNLADWTTENKTKITEVFNSFQQVGADLMNLFGHIFGSLGETFSSWWKRGMAPVFDKLNKAALGIADTVMNIWNQWIYPVIQKVIAWAKDIWDDHLQPLVAKILSFAAKIGDFIATLWNNVLKPVVDWLVTTLKPIVMGVINTILGVIKTVIGVVSGVIGSIFDALGGLLDFITGVFSGDWEKAWEGIKNFFKGIWDAIWSVVKGVINLIIDGLNTLWSGLYAALATIVNGVGGIVKGIGSLLGQEWGWEIPSDPPLIPKLATGAVIPPNQEFLAVLGDQKRGTNIEAPLDTIVEGMMISLELAGLIRNNENQPTKVTFEVDGREFARATIPYFDKERTRMSVFAK